MNYNFIINFYLLAMINIEKCADLCTKKGGSPAGRSTLNLCQTSSRWNMCCFANKMYDERIFVSTAPYNMHSGYRLCPRVVAHSAGKEQIFMNKRAFLGVCMLRARFKVYHFHLCICTRSYTFPLLTSSLYRIIDVPHTYGKVSANIKFINKYNKCSTNPKITFLIKS